MILRKKTIFWFTSWVWEEEALTSQKSYLTKTQMTLNHQLRRHQSGASADSSCLLPSEEENVCCKRVTCITSYTSFANIRLDRDILEVCIKARCDIHADKLNFSMERFRKAGYRRFALWWHGKPIREPYRVLFECHVTRKLGNSSVPYYIMRNLVGLKRCKPSSYFS